MRWPLFLMLLVLTPSGALAENAARYMDLCRGAAIRAADANGVPRNVMLAITLVETRTKRGGQSGPWPWTVNVAGKGNWFSSRAAALLHAQTALAGGQKSFDVGCFQLNYRWHGNHFRSIDEMFEPDPSGAYAARFLKSLHQETGNWIKAAGLYHSRTDKHAKRYRALIASAVDRMGDKPIAEPPRISTDPPANVAERALPGLGLGRAGASLPATSGGVALVLLRRSSGGLLARQRPRDGS